MKKKIHETLSLATRTTHQSKRSKRNHVAFRCYSRAQKINGARVSCVPDPRSMFDWTEIDANIPYRTNNTIDYDLKRHLEAINVQNGCHHDGTTQFKSNTCNRIDGQQQCEPLTYIEPVLKSTQYHDFKFTTL